MTLATDSTNNTATLSGRELALNRRKAMALHGKTAVAKSFKAKPAMATYKPAAAAQPASVAAASRQSASNLALTPPGTSLNQGREASRARRQALSTAGKAALNKPAATQPAGRIRPQAAASTSMAEASAKTCGCGCNGTKTSCDTGASDTLMQSAVASRTDVVAVQPARGRALAQARRAALAQDGKSGLKRVAKALKLAATSPDLQTAMTDGVSGRQVSRQHRLEQSLIGAQKQKKASPDKRPSGRIRARPEVQEAPPKVEVGHTLSGRGVTGTMVERSLKVTGNEPGSCRAITGTEYIGAEQFDTICTTRPAPAPSKVGVSHTIGERKVTGTEVSRIGKVTGDEAGTCRGVTGTEYLAAERFDAACETRPVPPAAKVLQFDTAKGRGVTGTSVNRAERVTGNEPGSDRAITGTDYASLARNARAPEKVAVTHTSQGKVVTGTAVGHTDKITGDENGACVGVTGTEYLATEQFTGVCNTTAPTTPRKVSVMSTRTQQEVSGTGVGRSEKVTGDEAGSCRPITGSQYYSAENFGALCSTPSPQKVASMQTLAGRTLTGTAVGMSKNVTGDERGGCKPVTGTEYIGSDLQKAVCDAPSLVAPVAKVAVDQTWRGQAVTGTYVGRSQRVTGDEPGGCSPISGTPYIGRGQYNSFCESPALSDQEARIRTSASIPATLVTGDRPGAGGSKMTGDERGACEVISGTPYIGKDNTVSQCAPSGRFVTRPSAWEEPARAPAPLDFSISTPARAAQKKQSNEVTGTGYNSERITGPVNKANGLITGTPEFRHRDVAPAPMAPLAPSAPQEETPSGARRVTGEGSQSGRPVTGDAWSGLSRVSGTEGASTQSRNLSERGNPRGMGMNATRFKEEVEHPPVPDSRITGSSGNTGRGALVTLSGGARG